MRLFARRESRCTIVDGQVDDLDLDHGKGYAAGAYAEWGSITKIVTALVVAALVENGSLRYDDLAARYVPGNLPDIVTIGALVSHASGLPRVHAGMSAGIARDPYAGTDAAFLDHYLETFDPALLEQPGDEAYSSLGYAVLGRVLEVATAVSWIDAVQQLVMAPLGMDGVVLDPASDQVAAILGFNRRPRTPWAVSASAYAPAGALWSTLPTLARFGWEVLVRGGYDGPRAGWQREGDTFWHNGQTRDSGACLVLHVYAYAHVPADTPATPWAAVTSQIERLAPGFNDRVLACHSATSRLVRRRWPSLERP